MKTIKFSTVATFALSACVVSVIFASYTLASQNHSMSEFNSFPINIVEDGATPRVLINSSNDHQLYHKVYNDYSDLDGDGVGDIGYKHSIDYYGYFDSYKCYYYDVDSDTSDGDDSRFVADAITSDKYCNNGVSDSWTSDDGTLSTTESHDGEQWSGNFLNWVSSARIDSIRKVLFGGHRRVDTETETVLERAFLPHDAHSWVKYYSGSDIDKLTPFEAGVDYDCDLGTIYEQDVNGNTVVNSLCRDDDDDSDYFACSGHHSDNYRCRHDSDPYNYNCADHQQSSDSGYDACKDLEPTDQAYIRNRFDYDPDLDYLDEDGDGTAVDWKKVGVSFGNTTDVDMGNFSNQYSENYNEPPLIKAVKGNYSLWASNERWQCTWSGGSPKDNHNAENENDPAKSGIYAYSSSPHWNQRMGEGNYIARVQVCENNWIENAEAVLPAENWNYEHCKAYPGDDGITGTSDDVYKPTGLLQSYGDDKQMYFGMVSGSYEKHASGGVLVRNVGDLSDEVNVDSNGIFKSVAQYAGGPADNADAEGLINAWSLYRIVGYNGATGVYNDSAGDNCSWGLSAYGTVTADGRCTNWGNPFSEIYYQSINYLAGNGAINDYYTSGENKIPGLPGPQDAVDPLDEDSYCAKMFVVNLNASTISYDYDELDHNSYGPPTIWDSDVLPGDKDTSSMTDTVGSGEGIHGNNYFVGEVDLGSLSDDQLCTEKTVTSFGDTGGVCPEAPRLSGSYRMAGLAYYAHVEDIRPDDGSDRALEGTQTVDTFSVALASGLPVIEIPNPSDTTADPLITILPACRVTSTNPDANCALVEFKVVEQEIDATNNTASGSFYVNWEDSEQGGDYDQDMWGTIDYELDVDSNEIMITTQVYAQSSGDRMGFGYVISGTSEDGFHVHSGINGFTYADTVESGSPSCADNDGCNCRSGHGPCNSSDSGPSSKKFTLGTATAELLEDPLWYAAKWGGFKDENNNKLPDLRSEWDSETNATGESVADGIPDNYFYATNPRELEESLERVFDAILERTSSGTAAAVVSSNVSGEGALYQAYFEPLRKNEDTEARWLGTVQALWLDSYGYTRQDCSPPADYNIDDNGTADDSGDDTCKAALTTCVPNGRLDNYCVDQVVETFYDELDGRTKARVYESNEPYEFSAYSMQGVVTNYSAGVVTLAPNSMEGNVSVSSSTITLEPYTLTGTITGYDADTGEVEMTVAAGGWDGPDNDTFETWTITTSSGAGVGFSSDELSLVDGAQSFTITPSGSWLSIGDTLTLKTKNVIGDSGQSFNSWSVECLEGATAEGVLSSVSVQLDNSASVSVPLITETGDFSTCVRAVFSTYDLNGIEGESYSDWTVSNLSTGLGTGTSYTTITLANDGNVSFTVSPSDDWIKVGDKLLTANYQATTKELYEVSTIWNAREELYLPGVSDAALEINRNYSASADTGRYITTWVDKDLDNFVDAGEYRPFINTMFTETDSVSHTFFDVPDVDTAVAIVDYVRGIEDPGNTRNRTITYSNDDTDENVMRLGDIVNSTPTVVGSPQEGFDLLYYDDSYSAFKKQYIDRRTVIYAGGNDGLLHAFNGGFYTTVVVDDVEYVEYSVAGEKHDGTPATQHPLGAEIWAYAPFNLLTHLQWLPEEDYALYHVSYMDLKPRVFDAKIFADDNDHPNGWGTVLVAGMNLGGGSMNYDVDTDGDGTGDTAVTSKSAYVIFDVTNPESEPVFLGEIPMPDSSYTTVYPAVAAFQDVGTSESCTAGAGTAACNRWYLVFGNGPNDISSYETDQAAKLYYYDLQQLVTDSASPTPVTPVGVTDGNLPGNCSIIAINDSSNAISCEVVDPDGNQIANSFMGTPMVVDWDLDFLADSLYFGIVGDADSDSGGVMKVDFNNNESTAEWSDMETFYDAEQPVYAQVVPSFDNLDNHWLFFGTGRYFATADKTSTVTQSLYGVKDEEESATYPILESQLIDVTDTEVYTDGEIEESTCYAIDGTELETFDDLEEEIDTNADGWKLDLPLIFGTSGDPTTRNTTTSSLLGGVLFTTAFQPSNDPCEGEGQSRLYGLYYKTGTGYPSISPIFGTDIETVDGEVKYKTLKFVDLGRGAATSPAIHSGQGSGQNTLKVFTQQSTGAMIETEAESVNKIRSGRTSWQDR